MVKGDQPAEGERALVGPFVVKVWWKGKWYWKSPPLPADLDGAIRWVRQFHRLVETGRRIASFEDVQRYCTRSARRHAGRPNGQAAAVAAVHLKKLIASARREARALTKILGAPPAIALRLGSARAGRRAEGHYELVHLQSGVRFVGDLFHLPTLDT